MPLTYAVHLDGALVTNDMLDKDAELAAVLARPWRFEIPDEGAEYPSGSMALAVACRIKNASPDDLVTVVLWT